MNAPLGHLSHAKIENGYTTFKFLTPGLFIISYISVTRVECFIDKFKLIVYLYYILYISKINGEVITKGFAIGICLQ
jgi:hypothetical protein